MEIAVNEFVHNCAFCGTQPGIDLTEVDDGHVVGFCCPSERCPEHVVSLPLDTWNLRQRFILTTRRGDFLGGLMLAFNEARDMLKMGESFNADEFIARTWEQHLRKGYQENSELT